jgi:hypothetical protein
MLLLPSSLKVSRKGIQTALECNPVEQVGPTQWKRK